MAQPVAIYFASYGGFPLCRWVKEVRKINILPAFGLTFIFWYKNSVSPLSFISLKYTDHTKVLLAQAKLFDSECQSWYPSVGLVFAVNKWCYDIQNFLRTDTIQDILHNKS